MQSTCDCSGMTAASRATCHALHACMQKVCWNVVIRDSAALQGEHAHRVWNAIYSQQCFSDLNDTDTCQEQRIFYRLISGKPWHHCHAMLTPGKRAFTTHHQLRPVVLLLAYLFVCCTSSGCNSDSYFAGMHASVSAHIANEYLLDDFTETWGQNLPEFVARLGNAAVKERIENMYFTYLFVLRAVMKAGPMLASVDYSTGCSQDDMETKQLMQKLVSY